MLSQWYELKPAVLALRRNGKSLTFIEANLGIPRSTLAGWCKAIKLNETQRQAIWNGKLAGLSKARSVLANARQLEQQTIDEEARSEASKTLASLRINPELARLSLAMIYRHKQGGYQGVVIRSSNPDIIEFAIAALRVGFDVKSEELVCELHLHQGQAGTREVRYWKQRLALPSTNFKLLYQRMPLKSIDNTNHGVCQINTPDIAIQRKLVYLYKSFSEKIISTVGD